MNENGSLPSGSLLQKKSGSSDGVTETYYYECKRIGGPYQATQNVTLTDPIIRLGELYLNYAEAAFEAYGSYDGKVPGSSITSQDALDIIRNRAGMPGIREEYLASPEVYRMRIKMSARLNCALRDIIIIVIYADGKMHQRSVGVSYMDSGLLN